MTAVRESRWSAGPGPGQAGLGRGAGGGALPWRLTPAQLILTDVGIALFLGAAMSYFAMTKSRSIPAIPAWTGVVIALLLAAGIAARRRWPLPAVGVTLAASCALAMLGFGLGQQLCVVALPVYIVAAYRPWTPAIMTLITVLFALAVTVIVAPAPATSHGRDVVADAMNLGYCGIVVTATWVAGRAIRAVRTANQQRAQLSVQAERLRIARELHDVVAHSMSVIAVQAGVGRYVIHEQPAEAEKSLTAIETTSRAALTEMRQLTAALREEKPGDLLPTPGIGDIAELAEQTRRSGLSVDLTISGVPEELPAGLGLTAFRIVQEALTNVIKHAETDQSQVAVSYADSELRIEVTDRGCGRAEPSGGGHGLAGMRERVALYDGQLEVGPLPTRGFRVLARLPA